MSHNHDKFPIISSRMIEDGIRAGRVERSIALYNMFGFLRRGRKKLSEG